jgi:proline iminopeptidase
MKKTILNLPVFVIFFSFNICCIQSLMAKGGYAPIDTTFLIKINGIEQYLEIKGASRTNPVLLFIHGGPAWPATSMIRKYNQELTKDFVLVSWDQRNCGKSKTDKSVKLTTQLYVEDAHEVTEFLKRTFTKQKIYVAGHSWGSTICILLITKYPEDYSAYLGMGQFVNPNRSNNIVKEFVIQKARIKKDTATIAIMNSFDFSLSNEYNTPFESLMLFFQTVNPYITSDKVAVLEDPTQLYDDYNAIDWLSPLMQNGPELMKHMDSIRIDLFKYNKFKVPVYFLLGRYDYNTPSVLGEQYFNTIRAPKKKLFWFENSGHSPQWEEPTLFYQRVLQIASENTNHKD